MDESDEVGGGIKNSDVLEDAKILSGRSRSQTQRVESKEVCCIGRFA